MTHLQKFPMFAQMPPAALEDLEKLLRPITLAPGDFLFYENATGDSFYLLISGELEILKSVQTPEERLIALLKEGTFVGEMGLFDTASRRAASVRGRGACFLLEMTSEHFRSLLERYPVFAYEISRELNIRLRETNNAALRDLQEKNRELAKAYDELRAAQAQLIEKERLERELELAKQIQESILPKAAPILPGFAFGYGIFPTHAVGGDLFDFIPLDENRLGIMLGDVSDKGVPAAIFMALTRSLIRAEALHTRQPWEVLQRVNELLLDISDAPMFVTMIYGVLDRVERTFTYARAGHEAPLAFDAQANPLPVPRATGQPLCIFPDMVLDTQTLPIPAGTGMLLYTDGLTDATASNGDFFGLEKVWEVLRACQGQPAPQIAAEVVRAVQAFQPARRQYDDISLIVVTCDA